MLPLLYPITFAASLVALTGWFYNRDNDRAGLFQKVFYASIGAFGVCWVFSTGNFSYKLVALGRELIVLAVAPFALSLFRKRFPLFLALSAVAGLTFFSFYWGKLKTTFPQAVSLPVENPLDENGEWLLELKAPRQLAEIQSVLNKYGLEATPAFHPQDKDATDLDDYFVVNVPDRYEQDLGEIKKALEATGLVEWLEENEAISIAPIEATPMRPLPGVNKKFGLNDPGLENLWGFESMKVDELYDFLKDKKPVKKAKIAILDTGIDAGHEDLKDNFFSTQSKYDTDKAGHGTHCAGIAAAVSNNNKGVASFSQNNDFVQVTSIKVLSDGGFGSQKMIIDGILEAADAGVDVISLSLGGPSSDSRQRSYQKAVEYANRKGAIVVVAAGNSNRNATGFAPANAPGVIAVSAVDTLHQRASFSNFVQDINMAVAAPGVKIYSTIPGSVYATFNGTSMATPYVSGLVGLMKSFKPSLTTKQAFGILKKSGTETKNPNETGKLIQPSMALKELLK